MRVLVVGGADSLLDGAFGAKLAEHGIEIAWREVEPSKLGVLPVSCEGVLVIRDLVSHSLSWSAVAAAKARGLPCAQIPRKWAQAYPILRRARLVR